VPQMVKNDCWLIVQKIAEELSMIRETLILT
jgi:hypothetical protein